MISAGKVDPINPAAVWSFPHYNALRQVLLLLGHAVISRWLWLFINPLQLPDICPSARSVPPRAHHTCEALEALASRKPAGGLYSALVRRPENCFRRRHPPGAWRRGVARC